MKTVYSFFTIIIWLHDWGGGGGDLLLNQNIEYLRKFI